MPEDKTRIKDFFDDRTQQITAKIEKTPMEKFFVFFLILITISAVVLGYFQFRKNLEGPLASSKIREERGRLEQQYSGSVSFNPDEQIRSENVEQLQRQDSDLDGLSDYSEIYFYKTSAYLEDTDGDGLLDKDEITQGTNPLCPEGEVCDFVAGEDFSAQPPATSPAQADNQNANINQSVLQNIDISDMEELQTKLLSGEINLADLGIDDPDLEAQLEALREAQQKDVEDLTEEEKQAAKENISNLSIEEIRSFMKQELEQRDLDSSILEQMSDEELRQLFNQSLESL